MAAWPATCGISRRPRSSRAPPRRTRPSPAQCLRRADVELTVEERADAAALVISPHAVIGDRTAAWIWGVDCFACRELDVVPPLETRTIRGHRASARAEHPQRGSATSKPTDLVFVGGRTRDHPVADGPRPRLPPARRRDALAAIDALARAHASDHRAARARAYPTSRRRGVVQLRELAALVDAACGVAGRVVDADRDARPGTSPARGQLVGLRGRSPEVPARSGVSARAGRHRVRR